MDSDSQPASASIFLPGENCHNVSSASFARVLIDYAHYYRALHEAILKARRSIFVLGWDIDGRIRLIRDGETAKEKRSFFQLIQHVARENPDLQIYLNRWDYSAFMAKDRELLGSHRWRKHSPDNIRYCLDNAAPTGACHHQKIIVIDDETAFCGGMDIALNRWDMREHMPADHRRIDPGALDNQLHVFEPYHDVQMVVSGPVVRHLAIHARERWCRMMNYDPAPLRDDVDPHLLPPTWPESYEPYFCHVDMAISLTQPAWGDAEECREVERMYLDLIGRAEKFIYIENQFLCQDQIARALNKRLHEMPELRVLAVSCYDPKGVFERKSMWATRVKFRDILESGGVANRVTMASVISRWEGIQKPVRIHTKLMTIDDNYLRIGSSNINNRSMGLDTECDLIIEAKDDATRQRIAAIRNDLIREHSGHELADIQKTVDSGLPEHFLKYLSTSRQHLCKINDEQYRYEKFVPLAVRMADPYKPFLPVHVSMALQKLSFTKILFIVALVVAISLAWKFTPLAEFARPDTLAPLLDKLRDHPLSVPMGILAYVVCTLAFFPHMAMTGTVVLIFAPLQAFIVCMTGSIISGAIGFFIGRKLGMRSMRSLFGHSADRISGYAKKGGLLGIIVLRMIPIAPYTVVNLVLGMLEVSFFNFIVGTFLGTLPGTAIASYLGHSALEVFKNPNDKNLWLLGGGIAAWLSVIVGSQLFARWWRKRHGDAQQVSV